MGRKRDKSGKKRRDEYKELIENERRGHGGAVIEGPSCELSETVTPHYGSEEEKGEERIPLNDDYADLDMGEGRKKGVSPNFVKLVCVFTVIFSLAAALVIVGCAVFYSERGDRGGEDDITVSPEAETNSKVIYVKEYDSESGLLTPSELYDTRGGSVVTVRCDIGTVGSSVGSGFVFTEDGYIATANHVIDGAEDIRVTLSDGAEYGAHLICGDSLSDIALLKIEASGLSPIIFGRSSELLVGERIYAIGTPVSVEYAGTFSSGEITYVDRMVDIESSFGVLEKRMKLLQTNAVLNKGNSGCPIFDGYGRVVGMVTMRLGESYTGLSFAIPSDGLHKALLAMKGMERIDADTVSDIVTLAPRLGVTGDTVESDGVFGYKVDGFVDCGSTASSALRIGDVIVEIDGNVVYRESDITESLTDKAPKDTVSVTVLRSGQRLTFEVALGRGSGK